MYKVTCELTEDYWPNDNCIATRNIKKPYSGTRKYKTYGTAVKRMNEVIAAFKDEYDWNEDVADDNARIKRDKNGNIILYVIERFLDGEYKNFYVYLE